MKGLRVPTIEQRLFAMLAVVPGEGPLLLHLCQGIDDWDELFRQARKHGVAGVLLPEIAASGYALPEGVERRESRDRVRESLFNGVLVQALGEALRVLASKRIDVAPLKGPVLAERLYKAPDHRPSCDMDLLVRPDDLDRAVQELATLGYVLEGGASGRYFRDHHHHVHLHHPMLPVVELHYHAYRGFGVTLPSTALLDRAVPYQTAKWSAATLSPEDELLYLAVHGASHRFERVGWLYDLKLFVRAYPDLDWSLVAARARALGFSAVLSLTCDLLSGLLGVPRAWGDAVAPLGTLRGRATGFLLPRRESAAANAATLFGFNMILCTTPSIAAKSAARFVTLKVFNEIPRRIAGALAGHK